MGKKSAKRVRRAWTASRGSGNEQPLPATPVDTCSLCHRPLIEIDHYGERRPVLAFEFGEFSPEPISSALIECLAFDQHLEICACFGRIATGAFKPGDDPLLIFDQVHAGGKIPLGICQLLKQRRALTHG